MVSDLNLEALLSPMGVSRFLHTTWAREGFVGAAESPDRFKGLFDLADFEFLLGTVAAPGWLSFVKDIVKTPSREQLTPDGTLSAPALYRAVADRQSVLLTRVHRLHAQVGALCRQITADFRDAGVVLRKGVRANAYFTPPNAQAFAAHYDDHDVIVLQLHGEKRWRTYGETVRWPRKPMPDALPTQALAGRAREIVLHQGDVLYLPRGFAHEARAEAHTSLHLTLSVESATWADIFERAIDLDNSFGEALPVGFCPGGAPRPPDRARLSELGAGMARTPEMARALADIVNRTWTDGDFPANGQLGRLEDQIPVAPHTWLAAADGFTASAEEAGDVAVLRTPGATLRAGKQAAGLFQKVAAAAPFRLADLGGPAGTADLSDLVQELISQGILVRCTGRG